MNQPQLYFNIHDVLLMLTVCLCALFALAEYKLKDQTRAAKLILVGLLLSIAMVPIHKVILFSPGVNVWLLEKNVNVFMIFSIGHWLEPPLLYLYTHFYLHRDARFEKKQLLHTIGPVFYLAFLYFAYYQYADEHKRYIISSWDWLDYSHFKVVHGVLHVSTVAYLYFSWENISQHKDKLLANYSSLAETDIKWLRTVVILYGARVVSIALAYFASVTWPNLQLGIIVGTLSNYFMFFMVCFLIYSRISYIPILRAAQELDVNEEVQNNAIAEQAESQFWLEHRKFIEDYMQSHKPYLKPGINLRELADMLNISSRSLSSTINRSFNVNFFEYINQYRIKEAKILLDDHSSDRKKITEIYLAVGFNNRSVFNKVFRNMTGLTPSEYRRSCLNKSDS